MQALIFRQKGRTPQPLPKFRFSSPFMSDVHTPIPTGAARTPAVALLTIRVKVPIDCFFPSPFFPPFSRCPFCLKLRCRPTPPTFLRTSYALPSSSSLLKSLSFQLWCLLYVLSVEITPGDIHNYQVGTPSSFFNPYLPQVRILPSFVVAKTLDPFLRFLPPCNNQPLIWKSYGLCGHPKEVCSDFIPLSPKILEICADRLRYPPDV